jgi:hypothetical protein
VSVIDKLVYLDATIVGIVCTVWDWVKPVLSAVTGACDARATASSARSVNRGGYGMSAGPAVRRAEILRPRISPVKGSKEMLWLHRAARRYVLTD